MNSTDHTSVNDPVGAQVLETIAKAGSFNQWMYGRIRPFLKGRILEIGSGIGNISAFAVEEGLTITLSDINTDYQDYLRQKFSVSHNVEGILTIDLQDPNFKTTYHQLEEKFDSIFLLNVIEHLEDDKQAVENCHFLLKKEGNLVLLAPAYAFLYCRFDRELGHFRRYTKRSLSAIFEKNSFVIISKKYFNAAGIAGWFVFGKLFNKKKIGGEMLVFNKLTPFFKLADRIVFDKIGLSVIIAARKS